jgi:plastocyanin
MRSLLRIGTPSAGLLLSAALLAGCAESPSEASDGHVALRSETQGAHGAPMAHSAPRAPREDGEKSAPKAAPNQVVIGNFAFQPATLTVKPGTKVTWVNRDDVPHTATSADQRKEFNSGTLDTDQQFSHVFKKPGTYKYFCALHPKMTGKIIVKK